MPVKLKDGKNKRYHVRFLVTGTAGFIGFHLARRLLAAGHTVAGLDSMTPYYDITLKERRNAILAQHAAFTDHRLALENAEGLETLIARFRPEIILHLAAQAGVRYSNENPNAYIGSNIVGTHNLLEAVRRNPVRHLLMASTSSVYGANTKIPFEETDPTDHQVSLYAASKKATESIGHSYAYLWKIPITALRFFTVYGPWGRPDMALFKFVQNTIEGRPIDIYNHGRMVRDFTYIDDLVDAVLRLIDCPPEIGKPIGDFDTLSPVAAYRSVNVGGGNPIDLLNYIDVIEKSLGMPAQRNYLPMQPGDVERTSASTTLLEALIGYRPQTTVTVGVPEFVRWYLDYYKS
jgi:UDP-glucuronate 4-epimerase